MLLYIQEHERLSFQNPTFFFFWGIQCVSCAIQSFSAGVLVGTTSSAVRHLPLALYLSSTCSPAQPARPSAREQLLVMAMVCTVLCCPVRCRAGASTRTCSSAVCSCGFARRSCSCCSCCIASRRSSGCPARRAPGRPPKLRWSKRATPLFAATRVPRPSPPRSPS